MTKFDYSSIELPTDIFNITDEIKEDSKVINYDNLESYSNSGIYLAKI